MRFLNEDQTHVYGECETCKKKYKIKRKDLDISYDGYKMKHSTVCSCGAVLKRIKGEVETKHCPECAIKLAQIIEICPNCGHDFDKAEVDLEKRKTRIFLISLFSFFGLLISLSGIIIHQTQNTNQTESQVEVDAKDAEEMDEEEKGEMYLVDGEGKYLGQLISDQTAPNSIFNTLGDYGMESSNMSIWNKSGVYGDKSSDVSAFNESAENPPQILYKGSFVAYVSKNRDLGKLTIDPDSIKKWIEDQGY